MNSVAEPFVFFHWGLQLKKVNVNYAKGCVEPVSPKCVQVRRRIQ